MNNKSYRGFPIKNAEITVRFTKPYKTIKRTVYFESGRGTYIIYKGRKYTISYIQHNNSGYTIKKY